HVVFKVGENFIVTQARFDDVGAQVALDLVVEEHAVDEVGPAATEHDVIARPSDVGNQRIIAVVRRRGIRGGWSGNIAGIANADVPVLAQLDGVIILDVAEGRSADIDNGRVVGPSCDVAQFQVDGQRLDANPQRHGVLNRDVEGFYRLAHVKVEQDDHRGVVGVRHGRAARNRLDHHGARIEGSGAKDLDGDEPFLDGLGNTVAGFAES